MEAARRHDTNVQRPDGSFVGAPGPAQAAIPATTNGNGKPAFPPWVTPPKVKPVKPVEVVGSGPVVVGGGLGGVNAPAPAKLRVVAPEDIRRIKGRTDEEWFGPMLVKVNELRGFVALFIQGLEQDPPVLLDNAANPEICALAIHQAALFVMEQQIPIPAMVDLLVQGMVADFLDVLLPDAPQAYRDDVARILMSNGETEEEDDDDDDDDDDDADAQPQVVS